MEATTLIPAYLLQSKDYYKILELSPSATLKEVKSSYRRLAHLLHPDKNSNDPYATARFALVKEAYEVLSNPSRKEHYLQQRWYDQVMNNKQTDLVITPVDILKRFIELDKYVSRLDVHRLDQQGLYEYINYNLSDEIIEKLNGFNEPDINTTIVESVLKIATSLDYQYVSGLSDRLEKLKSNTGTHDKILLYHQHSRKSASWHRLKIWLLLLVVIMICFLIYFLSA